MRNIAEGQVKQVVDLEKRKHKKWEDCNWYPSGGSKENEFTSIASDTGIQVMDLKKIRGLQVISSGGSKENKRISGDIQVVDLENKCRLQVTYK